MVMIGEDLNINKAFTFQGTYNNSCGRHKSKLK